ncbi:MAG: hypothetical protein ACAH59_08130 [Pseudobdellovibrionaceae bacterium]
MKKAVYTLLMSLTVVACLIACKKSDDGGGSEAATPAQDCNIPGNPGCQPQTYQQFGNHFLPYNWTLSNGFCGCPTGYRPVMNPQWGISCAQDFFFNVQYSYNAYNYNTVLNYSNQATMYPTQNSQWTSIPQVTYSPTISQYSNGYCPQQAASVCNTGLNDAQNRNVQCGNYQGYCLPAGGGTRMGFCTYGYGQENYNTGGNCYRYSGTGMLINVCTYGFSGNGYYGSGLPR